MRERISIRRSRRRTTWEEGGILDLLSKMLIEYDKESRISPPVDFVQAFYRRMPRKRHLDTLYSDLSQANVYSRGILSNEKKMEVGRVFLELCRVRELVDGLGTDCLVLSKDDISVPVTLYLLTGYLRPENEQLLDNFVTSTDFNTVANAVYAIERMPPIERISFWDSEKERLVLLTEKYLYTIKYDFIALKILDQRKTALEEIDTLLIGELIYPSASIIPHLDGLASGVSSIVKGCLVRPIQERLAGMPSCTTTSHLNFREGFEARSRNLNGIRIMWSKGQPLSFLKKWNPFEKDIPFATFASHPLLWHKDEDNKESKIFNVDDFILEMKKVLHERIQILQCSLQHRPVVLENYLGVGALIHNKHSLGFFKVRGKFSF